MSALYQTEAEHAREVPAGDAFPGLTVYEAIATGARSEKTGKPFGPAAWRDAGMRGSAQTCRSATDAIRSGEVPPLPGSASAPEPEAPEPGAGEGYTFTDNGEKATASGIVSGSRPTEDEMYDRWGIDRGRWECERIRIQEWNGHQKHQRYDGVKRADDVSHEVFNWLVRMDLVKRKGAMRLRAFAEALAAEIRPAPALPGFRQPPKSGAEHAALWKIADAHHGKRCWTEDGEIAYDLEISEALYRRAVDQFAEGTANYRPGEIVVVTGSDAANIDGASYATTAGTAQSTSPLWQLVVDTVARCNRYKIERAREIAPVRVVVVPGNHDEADAYYQGLILEAFYRADKHVTVDNRKALHKTHRHGLCGWLWAHGKEIKGGASLASFFALAAPEVFAATRWREVHTDHLHNRKRQRIQPELTEEGGVVWEQAPSISPPDEWHSRKGYVGAVRGAEARVYHAEAGPVATLPFTVLPPAPERMAA